MTLIMDLFSQYLDRKANQHLTFNQKIKFIFFDYMNTLLLSCILAIILALVTFLASILLASRSNLDREKIAPFECGFDPKNFSRIPFSLRFFLLALIFLVFDIEIILLLPVPLIKPLFLHFTPLIATIIFLLILTAGLIHEWHEGALNWSY